MPANFTRRRDLLLDSGYGDPERVLAALSAEVAALGLPAEWGTAAPPGATEALRAALAPRLARLPADQRRLARHVPEFVTVRSGDLATALWLARAEHGDALDLPGFLLAVLDALLSAGRERDALAYARFMLDLRFDWGRLYREPHLAYGFTRTREPNPLVWRLLEELGARGERLRVLELGCGVGNDAFGFLGASAVDGYAGVDVSQDALDAFRARVERERPPVVPALVAGDFAEVLERPPEQAAGANLVYSYSSLHYFSSGELARIHALVRRLLLASEGDGFFAFGIKGAGSVWEGQGLPLYRPDVWVNWDGQSRWFPSREALARQLDRAGFEIRFHELHEHWGYSEHGKRDVFHYVLCSPRAGE
ncbi:class I SAM-dependent methyltransferase [Anaeromyxobacter terrae]|uniref:class I SAM-dependent methyltransferase n=1 Tax=Anaeromyxobacter terrae TaxID=2925406 RepID=UPI001F56E17B|nr:class I SAM-dependent methyltransferase [Anaeromyxobacter sp. SG22]